LGNLFRILALAAHKKAVLGEPAMEGLHELIESLFIARKQGACQFGVGLFLNGHVNNRKRLVFIMGASRDRGRGRFQQFK